MHGRIKWALLCLLIALNTAACTTVRYRKMVGVHFFNLGPNAVPAIKVTSGNCTWPLGNLETTGEYSGPSMILYCTPSEQLNVHWQTAKGEPREINIPVQAPIQHRVVGWQLAFAKEAVTVRQLEEADRMLPRIVKQIYP